MSRAIATLLTLVAIASPRVPAWWVEASAASAPPKSKSQAAPRSSPRTLKPSKARSSTPGSKPSPAPEGLESDTGPAASDAAKLARVRSRRQAVEREILKLQSQTESTLRELDSIDLDLRLAAHQLDEAELEFKETTRLLDATLRDVQVTRNGIEAARPRVRKSIIALNKLGELGYARLLFSLDDPADMLRGFRYVSRIASVDAAQILEFRTSLTRLSGLEASLKKRTAENLDTRRRLNQARSLLSAGKAHKQARVEEIAREQQLQEQLAEEYRNREAELLRLVGESGAVGPSGQGAGPDVSPKAPFEAGLPLRGRRGDLAWPVGGTLLRRFGVERDPKFGTQTVQQGIEIDAFPEVEVRAVSAGRVVFADQFVGYGLLVIVDHGHREHTLYGRLGELQVSPGDDVAEGSLLGLLPNTRVTGTGLHFEVRVQGKPEDPLEWLRKP